MSENLTNESNELIENGAANLVNAAAKVQADELRNSSNENTNSELSLIQQETAALNANTQAQKYYNEEKQKTVEWYKAIENAYLESAKVDRSIVYHGTGANFNNFNKAYAGTGVGSQSYGEGVYLTTSKQAASYYAENAGNSKDPSFIIKNMSEDIVKSVINDYVKNVLTVSIPDLNNPKNYFDLAGQLNEEFVKKVRQSFNFSDTHNEELHQLERSLKDRKEYPNADTSYDHYARVKTNDNFRDMIKHWTWEGSEDVDFDRQILRNRLGYKGVKTHGQSVGEQYVVMFNPDDANVLYKEDLSADKKKEMLDNRGIDSSIVQSIQFVDQSLKSFIESLNSTTRKINELHLNGNTQTYNLNNIKPVEDLLITDTGEIYESHPKDNILFTQNNISGLRGVKQDSEATGAVVGTLSGNDIDNFLKVVELMKGIDPNKDVLTKSELDIQNKFNELLTKASQNLIAENEKDINKMIATNGQGARDFIPDITEFPQNASSSELESGVKTFEHQAQYAKAMEELEAAIERERKSREELAKKNEQVAVELPSEKQLSDYEKAMLELEAAMTREKERREALIKDNEDTINRMVKGSVDSDFFDIMQSSPDDIENFGGMKSYKHYLRNLNDAGFNKDIDGTGMIHQIPEYIEIASEFRKEALKTAESLNLGKVVKEGLKDNIFSMFDASMKENKDVTGDEVYRRLQSTVDAVDGLLSYVKENLVYNTSDDVQQRLKEMDERDWDVLNDRKVQEDSISAVVNLKDDLIKNIETTMVNSVSKAVLDNTKNTNLSPEQNAQVFNDAIVRASDSLKTIYDSVNAEFKSADDKTAYIEGYDIQSRLAQAIKISNDTIRDHISLIEEQNKTQQEADKKAKEAEDREKRKNEINARVKEAKESKLYSLENTFKNLKMGPETDSKIRDIRNYYHQLEYYQSYMDNLEKNPLKTFSQIEMNENFIKRMKGIGTFSKESEIGIDPITGEEIEIQNNASGIAKEFEDAMNVLLDTRDKLKKEGLSDDERFELLLKEEQATEGFNGTMKRFLETMKDATEATKKEIDKEKELESSSKEKFYHDTEIDKGRINYDSYKYAWRRNAKQQTLFLSEYPQAFNTTGNLRMSAAKTLFNRSLGFRQRQGIVGLASNLGYNNSGVGASLLLGALATGLKKATQAVLDFAKGAVQAYGEIEAVKTNLGIVYGSQSQANAAFNEIAEYSIRSPFGIQTVSEYAVLLKQSGIYASDLMDTLKQIGDVAGGNQQKFANIANSFSQIEANGKATTRQLRQFATAGIPIYKELTKAYKEVSGQDVSIEQIRKLTESGKITSDIIERAFSNMTGAGGIFENAVNIGAKTWKARRQNLADAKQLAQAQLGEFMINFGGSGRGDSIAQSILSIQETLYQGLQQWFELKNISNDVKDIKKKNGTIKQLQDAIQLLRENGASPESIAYLEAKIKDYDSDISMEKERATALAFYNSYMEQYKDKTLLSNTEIDALKATAAIEERLKSNKKGYFLIEQATDAYMGDYTIRNRLTEEEYGEYLTKITEAKSKLETVKSKEDYERDLDIVKDSVNKAFQAKADSIFATANETLDKAINKNSNGIGAMYLKGEEEYRSSAKGKKEENQKELNKRYAAQADWDKYRTYIDESGNLLDTFKGTIKDAIDMYRSGIIAPIERYGLLKENLSGDSRWVSANREKAEEQREERKKEWETILQNMQKTILSLYSSNELSEHDLELISELENTMYKGGTKQSDHTIFGPDGSYTIAVQNAFAENTDYAIDRLGTVFGKVLEGLDNKQASELLGYTTTLKGVNNRPQIYNDTLPLWQRIISTSLGVDQTFWKQGAIKNGKDAVSLFSQSSERNQIKSIMSAMLQNQTLGSVLLDKNSNRRISVSSNSSYANNDSPTKVIKEINWNETYKNFQKFASGLDSAAYVTEAYTNSLNEEVSTLKSFILDSIFTMEEPANIYDIQYQQVLGKYADSIKAVNANAFELLFDDIGNGNVRLKENATSAAQELLVLTENLSNTTAILGAFKSSLEDIQKETAMNRMKNMLQGGAYDNNGIFTNKREENEIIFNAIESTLSKLFESNRTLFGDLSLEDAIQETLKNGSLDWISLQNITDTTAYDQQLEEEKKLMNSYASKRNSKFDDMSYYDIVSARDLIVYQKNAEERLLEQIKLSTDKYAERDIFNLENAILNDEATRKELQAEINARYYEEEHKTKMEQLQKQKQLIEEENSLIKESVVNVNNASIELKRISSIARQSADTTRESNNISNWNALKAWITPNSELYKNISLTNPWGGFSQLAGNNYRQGKALNALGLNDQLWEDVRRSHFGSVAVDDIGKLSSTLNKRALIGLNNTDVRNLYNSIESLINAYQKSDSEDEKSSLLKSIMNKQNGLNSVLDEIAPKEIFKANAIKEMIEAINELGGSIKKNFDTSIIEGFNKTMTTLGSNIYLYNKGLLKSGEGAKNLRDVWKEVGINMLQTIGPAMTEAGFSLVSAGARNNNFAEIAAGISLVAAGGVTSMMGGFFDAANNKDKDDETEKLERLKDLLKDIIDQAKTDANYYEQNMRHNNAISLQSVNDMILTPHGNFSTAPDDYIIATKNPQSLGNSGTVINFKIEDHSTDGNKVQIRQERKQNPDGSVDIVAYVVATVGEKIANGDMDGYFAAQQQRLNGNSYAG